MSAEVIAGRIPATHSLTQALQMVDAGQADKPEFLDWLAGRADLADAVFDLMAEGTLEADEAKYVAKAHAETKAANLAASAGYIRVGDRTCPVNAKQWVQHAAPIKVADALKDVVLRAKVFKSGSFGYYANGAVDIPLPMGDGRIVKVPCTFALSMSAKNSKPKADEEE